MVAALIACLATVHARQERMRMDFARPHPTGTRPPGRGSGHRQSLMAERCEGLGGGIEGLREMFAAV